MKQTLKHIPFIKYGVIILRTLTIQPSFRTKVKALGSFFSDYKKYQKLISNPHFALSTADLFPRIYDKTGEHKLDPVYFYQNAWCAHKIFTAKPERHVDVGSAISLISVLSQFTPVEMVDIRPIPYYLSGLTFKQGDILALPYENNSINSLSSICVIEHIGLGRYGDTLDSFGSEKAAKELVRVLAHNGSLYITVPIDSTNKIYFNAHRAFTRDYILKLFSSLTVVQEQYLYGNMMQDTYEKEKGFGTGMFHFRKQ